MLQISSYFFLSILQLDVQPVATPYPNTISHFASQSQTHQLLKIFFCLFFYVESVSQSSHYSSTNNYQHYLLEVRMRVTSAWVQE